MQACGQNSSAAAELHHSDWITHQIPQDLERNPHLMNLDLTNVQIQDLLIISMQSQQLCDRSLFLKLQTEDLSSVIALQTENPSLIIVSQTEDSSSVVISQTENLSSIIELQTENYYHIIELQTENKYHILELNKK